MEHKTIRGTALVEIYELLKNKESKVNKNVPLKIALADTLHYLWDVYEGIVEETAKEKRYNTTLIHVFLEKLEYAMYDISLNDIYLEKYQDLPEIILKKREWYLRNISNAFRHTFIENHKRYPKTFAEYIFYNKIFKDIKIT
jgi:hypothetical protein